MLSEVLSKALPIRNGRHNITISADDGVASVLDSIKREVLRFAFTLAFIPQRLHGAA